MFLAQGLVPVLFTCPLFATCFYVDYFSWAHNDPGRHLTYRKQAQRGEVTSSRSHSLVVIVGKEPAAPGHLFPPCCFMQMPQQHLSYSSSRQTQQLARKIPCIQGYRAGDVEGKAWNFLRENTNWFRSWVLPLVFQAKATWHQRTLSWLQSASPLGDIS